jgi:hypothetical protein
MYCKNKPQYVFIHCKTFPLGCEFSGASTEIIFHQAFHITFVYSILLHKECWQDFENICRTDNFLVCFTFISFNSTYIPTGTPKHLVVTVSLFNMSFFIYELVSGGYGCFHMLYLYWCEYSPLHLFLSGRKTVWSSRY